MRTGAEGVGEGVVPGVLMRPADAPSLVGLTPLERGWGRPSLNACPPAYLWYGSPLRMVNAR
ncbi:hypothetical protein WA016_02280 [Myxococcus stipitatus]